MIVYGRKHSYRLYCKLLNEATRWANSIQNVIDGKAPIDTPTQQLIQDIKVGKAAPSVCEVSPWRRKSRLLSLSAGELSQLGGGGADLQEEPHPSLQPPPSTFTPAAAAVRRHPPPR